MLRASNVAHLLTKPGQVAKAARLERKRKQPSIKSSTSPKPERKQNKKVKTSLLAQLRQSCNSLVTSFSSILSNFHNAFNRELNLFYFSNLRYRNNKTYFRLLLLYSGDTSLNPGPINDSQQHNYDQWAVCKKRGLHFVHISINSLLPKIDEL